MNIVHSIDAWVVREMVRRGARKDIQIATIHDAFYAHPNDMQFVRETYRDILAELAESNLGQSILTEVAGQYVPFVKLGNISNLIRKSEYALS